MTTTTNNNTLTNTITLQSYYVENQDELRSALQEVLPRLNLKFTLEAYENQTEESVEVKLNGGYLTESGNSSFDVYFDGETLFQDYYLSINDEGTEIEFFANYTPSREAQTRIILNRIEESLSKFSA